MKSSNIEDFSSKLQSITEEYEKRIDDQMRVFDTFEEGIKDLPQKVVSIHEDFERNSELTNTDIAFAVLGITFREIVNNIFRAIKIDRVNDKEAADKVHQGKKEKSQRTEKYFASIPQIITNPVPFDAITSSNADIKSEVVLGGSNHRFKTIGHDPILGFIFGTANIMTNTITISTGVSLENILPFKTYHVGTMPISEVDPTKGLMDKLYERADTREMFISIIKRIQDDYQEGFTAYGTAIIKELVHLLSDIKTAHSLPIPFIGVLSPNISRRMQLYLGIDSLVMASNTVEYIVAKMVDYGILVAREFWWKNVEEGVCDEQSLQARLKKIETFINDGAIVGESFYMVRKLISKDVKQAIQGYSFGSVLHSVQTIINNGDLINQLRHEYVVKHATEYINNL